MRRISILALFLALLAQGVSLPFPGPGGFASGGGGTAPSISSSTGWGNEGSSGTSIRTCCISVSAGQSVGAIVSGTPGTIGFGEGTNSTDVDTATCGHSNTYGTYNETEFCWIPSAATTTGASTYYHCTDSASTAYLGCVAFVMTCQEAPCVVENYPSYTNTSGTGGTVTLTAGSVTTAYQANEMIVGACTLDNYSTTYAGTMTAGSGYSFYTHSTELEGSTTGVYVETLTTSATGSYAATEGQTVSPNTSCLSMSFY